MSDCPDADEREVDVSLTLSAPFFERIAHNAGGVDEAGDWMERALWVECERRDYAHSVHIEPAVEIPAALYERAKLKRDAHRASGSESTLENVLLNLAEVRPTYTVDGEPVAGPGAETGEGADR